jgi:hypothetical protein
MNKKVLIISPYFPPSNTADMQRIRTSLPYFESFGWEPTLVVVAENYSDAVKDELLNQSVPATTKIYKVKALSQKVTQRFGLGSLAIRSFPYYRKTVNRLLATEKFDLIYFSTTQFMITVLGAYWKKKYGIPYVIDMQDPWYSTYYRQKQRDQQPAKYRMAYTLHKYLEPVAIRNADGLISVSASYIDDLQHRYAGVRDIPYMILTFGAFAPDNQIAIAHAGEFEPLLSPGFVNIVYVGRGGADMQKALSPVFSALRWGRERQPELFKKLKFYFIGTSYAPAGTGKPTVLPLARRYGVGDQVVERTDRISYFHTLATLQQADALLIPGSEDPRYTASKIYPYLLSGKPLTAIFHEQSNSVAAIRACAGNALLLTFNDGPPDELVPHLYQQLADWAERRLEPIALLPGFAQYTAEHLTRKQTEFFDLVIAGTQAPQP